MRVKFKLSLNSGAKFNSLFCNLFRIILSFSFTFYLRFWERLYCLLYSVLLPISFLFSSLPMICWNLQSQRSRAPKHHGKIRIHLSLLLNSSFNRSNIFVHFIFIQCLGGKFRQLIISSQLSSNHSLSLYLPLTGTNIRRCFQAKLNISSVVALTTLLSSKSTSINSTIVLQPLIISVN